MQACELYFIRDLLVKPKKNKTYWLFRKTESDLYFKRNKDVFQISNAFPKEFCGLFVTPIKILTFLSVPGKNFMNEEWSLFWKKQFFDPRELKELFQTSKSQRYSFCKTKTRLDFFHFNQFSWYNLKKNKKILYLLRIEGLSDEAIIPSLQYVNIYIFYAYYSTKSCKTKRQANLNSRKFILI